MNGKGNKGWEWFPVAGSFGAVLLLFLPFLIANPVGTVIVGLVFSVFIMAIPLLVGKRPFGLSQTWGRLLCGLLSALFLTCSWSAEGWMDDALITAAIMVAVLALIYPLFTLSSIPARTREGQALAGEASTRKKKKHRKQERKRFTYRRKRP